MKRELLRLFKAVEIKDEQVHEQAEVSRYVNTETLKLGFVFSPEVHYNYGQSDMFEYAAMVIEELGVTPEQMNNAFHKSWDKIVNADFILILLEQAIHYATTYGFESIGTYSDETVFIPKEKIDIPDLEDGIRVQVIKGMTKYDIRVALMDLLDTGIALKEDTVNDCIALGHYIGLSNDEINSIKNKEVKTALFDKLGGVPKDPVEFLRYVVYRVTGKTLLIKNFALIEQIKQGDLVKALDPFKMYKDEYGLNKLAEIFNRFKPIFLAFKEREELKTVVNKISKLSKRYHKPMRSDYLNDVTAKIKNDIPLNYDRLESELSKVNNFRKIRLAYALNYRIGDVDSILYKVRNGKGYSTEFDFKQKKAARGALAVVLDSIVDGIRPNVEGKKVYLPDYVRYALPATEKQFTGNFPSGTSVTVDKDMVFGIHWTDVSRNRIDLDLSLIDINGYKYGWDGGNFDNDRNIIFSGDMTSAPKPNGATELFHVAKESIGSNILIVNYFNYREDIDVPFKIIVGQDKAADFKKNYMIDPNNVLMVAQSKMDVKQKVLGLLLSNENGCRFYFTEVNMGKGITSGASEHVMRTRKYMFDFYKDSIDIDELLLMAGVEFVDEVEDCDIDLSPENIKKDDIINLLV